MKLTKTLVFFFCASISAKLDAVKSTATPNIISCCKQVQSALPASAYTTGESQYQAILGSYFSVTNRLQPSCFVQPKSVKEVSQLVTILSQGQCKFAVKGGGTQLVPGINDIIDGVTIDLSKLHNTTVNANKTVVSVQAGAKWGDVYRQLDPHGLTVAGGSATNVGVAGQTLGGGYSSYRYQYGWTFDSVQKFEIVLGNGTITYAASDYHADLFKALKGGLGNLGIVTRIDFIPIRAGPQWGGVVNYNFTDIKKFYRPVVEFTNNAGKRPQGSLVFTWTGNATSRNNYASFSYIYTGNPFEAPYYNYTNPSTTSDPLPAPFAPFAFNKIGTPYENTLRIDSVYNINYELNGKNNSRFLTGNVLIKCDLTTLSTVDAIAQEALHQYLDQKEQPPYDNVQILYLPVPRVITDISNRRGGNVLGLDRVKDNSILLVVLFNWSDPSKDPLIRKLMTTILTKVTDYTKSVPGAFRDWQYSGLVYQDQDPLGSQGNLNVAYLKSISQKYDPHQVFQNLIPGGWKLGDAGAINKEYNFNHFVASGSNE